MLNSKKWGVKFTQFLQTRILPHKAWHDTSEEIKKIQYPMIGDPTWTLAKNFDVLIEAEGLADQLVHS